MLKARFGIEIEFTGITKDEATRIVANHLNGRIENVFDGYKTRKIYQQDGRAWKIMNDGSIKCQRKVDGIKMTASTEYSCELVSPILTYKEDIDNVQELVRLLRKAGAFTNSSCGIHIHLDGGNHTSQSIRNFVNIIASKNDLFYKALEIEPERMRFCKKMDSCLVEKLNKKKPKTLKQIEDIWYEGYNESRTQHYNQSRYHFLNLHSFFNGHGTVELRGFNSELHAGKIRSYIILALGLNNQALTQKSACRKKPQAENEKFAMRTYLNRIGFIGEDYKNCREHLCKPLNGSSAWRFGAKTPSLQASY